MKCSVSLFVGAVLFAVTMSSLARNREHMVRGDVDPKTGIRFPMRVGGFEREGHIAHETAGYPEATYLLDRTILASVFYHKARLIYR
jgi:hypothetical protein